MQVEHGFSLWANGHLIINVVESAQRLGTRFKFIGQQKDWVFTFDKWGCGVNDYVAFVLEMEPENHLALCDDEPPHQICSYTLLFSLFHYFLYIVDPRSEAHV